MGDFENVFKAGPHQRIALKQIIVIRIKLAEIIVCNDGTLIRHAGRLSMSCMKKVAMFLAFPKQQKFLAPKDGESFSSRDSI
jgi:hypothetical protein